MGDTNGVYASGKKKPAKQKGGLEFPMRKAPSWRVRAGPGAGAHGEGAPRRSSSASSTKGGRLHHPSSSSLGPLRRLPSSLMLLVAVLVWLLGSAFLKAYRNLRQPGYGQEVVLARGIYSGGRGQRQSLMGSGADLRAQQAGSMALGAWAAAHTGNLEAVPTPEVAGHGFSARTQEADSSWRAAAGEGAQNEAAVPQGHDGSEGRDEVDRGQAAHASQQRWMNVGVMPQRTSGRAMDGLAGSGQGMSRSGLQGGSSENSRNAGVGGTAAAVVRHVKPPPPRLPVRRAARAQTFKVALFSVPQCAVHTSLEMHMAAVHSWLRLQQPPPDIFLLGSDPALQSVAAMSPEHVHVVEGVDTNMEGVPQLHSVLARMSQVATAQAAEIVLLVDPSVVLFPDVLHAATKAASRFPSWLVAGASWHLAPAVQDIFVRELLRELRSGKSKAEPSIEVLQEFTAEFGSMHAQGLSPLGFLMWNHSPKPLLPFPVPPFAMGRGSHDPWLLHHLSQLAREGQVRGQAKGRQTRRQVVDASESIVSVRLSALREKGSKPSTAQLRVPRPKSWEFFANAHMAVHSGPQTGAFQEGLGTLGQCSWSLVPCYHAPARAAQQSGALVGPTVAMCLIRRVRPGNCSCEHSPFLHRSTADVRLHHDRAFQTCGTAQREPMDYRIDPVAAMGSDTMGGEEGSGAGVEVVPGVPHTLAQLLPRVADEHRTVVLAVAERGQGDAALNFACMLKALGVSSLMIAALHKATYRYLYVQGVPVYYAGDAFIPSSNAASMREQEEEQGAIWLRSSLALPILKQGYDVLITDPDFLWLRNALPHIWAFKNADIIVQSNEPNAQRPSNSPRRLNTGFMYLRARKPVVRAMRLIKDKASKPNAVAERNCFYDILCGLKGDYVKGTDKCRWKGPKLETLFLSRKLYPNGAIYRRGKDFTPVPICRQQGCYIVPSDRRNGKARCPGCPTFFDAKSRMCKHPWMSS